MSEERLALDRLVRHHRHRIDDAASLGNATWLFAASEEGASIVARALELELRSTPAFVGLAAHRARLTTAGLDRSLLDKAAEIASAAEDYDSAASIQWHLGWEHLSDGESEAASNWFNASLDSWSRSENPAGQGEAHLGLATSALAAGDHPNAVSLYRAAVDLFRRAGDHRAMADADWGLALAALEEGDNSAALEHFAAARGRASDSTQPSTIRCRLIDTIARSRYPRRGQFGDLSDSLTRVMDTASRSKVEFSTGLTSSFDGVQQALDPEALLSPEEGDEGVGGESLEERSYNDPWLQDMMSNLTADISDVMAEMSAKVASAFGDIAGSVSDVAIPFVLYEQATDPLAQGGAAWRAGSKALLRGEIATAKAAFHVMIDLGSTSGNALHEAVGYRGLASVDIAQGRLTRAIERYRQAQQLAENAESQEEQAVIALGLARSYRDQGQNGEAHDSYTRARFFFANINDASGIRSCDEEMASLSL